MAETERTAVITGAGSGIGLAMCKAFGDDGARVIAVDLDPNAAEQAAAAVTEAGGRAAHRACDVADPEEVERLGAWLDGEGGADVLCNNAGVFDAYTPVVEMEPAQWAQVIAVNLTAPYLVSRRLIPMMTERGGGAIVNTSSVAGMVAGAGGVAYTASKHGLVGLTRQLAQECGPSNIRVNAIAPGVIATGMSMPLIEDPSRSDFATSMIDRTPARRLGDADHVAHLAVYLASDAASFIQGALVPIDGGWTAI